MAKKRVGRFFHICVILFILLLLAGLGLLYWFWQYLAEYEKSTPRYAGQQLLALYQAGDYDGAMKMAAVDPSRFYDGDQYAAYMEQTLGDFGGIHIQEQNALSGEKKLVFVGTTGESVQYRLIEQPEALAYGLSAYTLEQDPVPLKGLTIRAPEQAVVLVNGEPLSLESRISLEAAADFPGPQDAAWRPVEAVYRIDGFAADPSLGIAERSEDEYQLVREGETAAFTLFPQEREAYEAMALETAQTYAKFVSRDAPLEELTRLLHPEMEFYRTVQHYNSIWYNSHDGVEFADLKAENTLEYAPDVFSTEISFDYVVYRGSPSNRWAEWVYPTRYRIYFLHTDNGWKVLEIRPL